MVDIRRPQIYLLVVDDDSRVKNSLIREAERRNKNDDPLLSFYHVVSTGRPEDLENRYNEIISSGFYDLYDELVLIQDIRFGIVVEKMGDRMDVIQTQLSPSGKTGLEALADLETAKKGGKFSKINRVVVYSSLSGVTQDPFQDFRQYTQFECYILKKESSIGSDVHGPQVIGFVNRILEERVEPVNRAHLPG